MDDMSDSIKKTFLKFYRIQRSLEYLETHDSEKAWEQIKKNVWRKRLQRRIVYISSGAAAIFVLFFSVYIFFNDINKSTEVTLFSEMKEINERGGGIILSLADGEKVDLSSLDGRVDSTSSVVNNIGDKRLVYTQSDSRGDVINYNSLEVPEGAEYQLVLSDGTKVWMNASSRLVYPVCFGEVREVRLEGEAYFDVAHDSLHPFIVKTVGMDVEVLGTEFNVNTRKGQTVLVDGQVQVETEIGESAVLKPGELVEVIGSRLAVTSVNVRKYVAWRYGEFYFEEATLEEIMESLGEWYGVNTVFARPALRQRRFSGILKREDSVVEVLSKIERTTSVHIVVQGKYVTVQ